MEIKKIEVQNYRLLSDFSMDLEKNLSLVIGKNNTGKTSILSVLDKFLNDKSRFTYDDLNVDFKNEFESLVTLPELPVMFEPRGIKLKIFIEYNESDDLSNVSRVLMDLDPENNIIVLGFEYTINYEDFIKLRFEYSEFKVHENEKAKIKAYTEYKPKGINDFLKKNIDKYFTLHRYSFRYDLEVGAVVESEYVDLISENISLRDIINFKYISAKRDVTNKEKEKTLSRQTSILYEKKENNSEKSKATEDFKDQLSVTDDSLSDIYKTLFSDVIETVKSFGGMKLDDTEIEIISTLQHRDLLNGNTTVVYSHDNHKLPEQYNGLGYMNLISIIFEIEILIQEFKRDKNEKPSDINLLFIEEPEAHTHPQMQYVFIKNIKNLLGKGIERDDGINRDIQAIITTHSSHIVSNSDFEDIKYLKIDGKNEAVAKNLSDLIIEYGNDTKQYQFLKQYLTISRAEIFFADKAILIEGDTERILMPTFMKKIDFEVEEASSLPLLSQNISIIEVGAYSQIFKEFIKFVGIKTLILTDIDSALKNGDACPVHKGVKTTNSSIKHYLSGVEWEKLKEISFEDRILLIGDSKVCLSYQIEEDEYHARSFEDAFINLNKDFIKDNIKEFKGLKNRDCFNEKENDPYFLALKCVGKKTHFALDILYHSNANFSNWEIPGYIKEGLLWLKED